MKATIHFADPEEHLPVEVDARDRRAFERTARKELGTVAVGPLKEVINTIPETYVLWMAWHSLVVRSKASSLSWKEFDERVVDIEQDEDEEDVDPTIPGPTGD